MYTPRAFVEDDLNELDRLIARDAFITLVTHDEKSGLNASHVPVLYARQGGEVRLRGHWARPNPQWRGLSGASALAIVHGPHAYVSPSWYATPDTHVPTWNYAVAHLTGHIRVFEDLDELAGLVGALARKYEDAIGSTWRFDRAAGHHPNELRGIVGFELVAERIELKFKLNQNHPDENVSGAIAGLSQGGAPHQLEIAALRKTRLDARSSGK